MPIYIMCTNENFYQIKNYWAKMNYFGLNEESVSFFA